MRGHSWLRALPLTLTLSPLAWGEGTGWALLRTHIALMLFYALATAIFFALLWKEQRRDRIRYFLVIFFSMFLGAIALGWVMYPLPR
ncbi:MAG TPA: hypothetical protein VNI54_13860 [Thermoanaerobaculia bacterium]|nr:hypothetical protein [Thermoanaerobaculia bacterium]